MMPSALKSHHFLVLITALLFAVPETQAQMLPGSNSGSNTITSDQDDSTGNDVNQVPPSLDDLKTIQRGDNVIMGKAGGTGSGSSGSGLPLDIRRDALKEAAMSYGARGGLAWRTFQISKELERRQAFLDKVYDFRSLLIAAPSGLLIEPPIISESQNAMIIENQGQQAAIAERIYNINAKARIVSAPRTWRQYLRRDWGKVEPPPSILRPKNAEERKVWRRHVEKGWDNGIDQANRIFERDLAALQGDFRGMVRYRRLLAKGMISPPYAMQVNRGITGGGRQMRVGDSAVQITGQSQLITGADQWRPVSR
jgi:defect-in-organelle-trafficking protein DotC